MEHPENSAEFAGLQVNSGVEQQSIINPYLKRGRFRRQVMSAADMVEGILKGDITILSQAVRPSGQGAGSHREMSALQWQECPRRHQRRAWCRQVDID